MSDQNFPPWTLKNVPTEQRNAAIMAAERAGQPIGKWVGRVIHEAAQRELTGKGREIALVPLSPPEHADVLGRHAETFGKILEVRLEPEDNAGRLARADVLRALRRAIRTCI